MSWSQLLLMPVVMEMTLLLLCLGGFWAQEVNTVSAEMLTSIEPSLVSDVPEAPNLNSVTTGHTIGRIPEKNDSTGHQIPPLPTITYTASELSSPETSIAASGSLSTSEPTIFPEVFTKMSPVSQEVLDATSNNTLPAADTLGPPTITGGTMANGNLETSNGPGEPPVTVATSSLDTSDGTSEPPITVATSYLETSSGTSGLPVTVATSSLDTSDGTSEPPITMATSYLEISSGTSGLPVTMATSSRETPKGTSGTPVAGVKVSIKTTTKSFTNTGSGPSSNSKQKASNTLLVPVLVALLVLCGLLALLVLWRRRQKRRTGVLTLSGDGKRNGVVDAWAGPAQVSDEEAVITTVEVSGGDKDSGIPAGEGSGRRPTLTTFFGRRKSGQGFLAMEELKAGSASSLKGEEEPLVGSEDGAAEDPTSQGPEAGDVEVPQCL